MKGVLRRGTSSGVDSRGDPIGKTYTTFNMEGFPDTYTALYKSQAGIPASDVKLLIIGGSLATRPQKDDQVQFRGRWYQVRAVSTDPGEATWELQSFEIADPT